MSTHRAWWLPSPIRIGLSPGEASEPIVATGLGSGIEPFMKPDEVRLLKDRFQSLQFRLGLSAFIAQQIYDLHLQELLKDSDQSPEEILREVVKTGTLHYITMEEIFNSEEWPVGYSPPEFYELARREMEGQANG